MLHLHVILDILSAPSREFQDKRDNSKCVYLSVMKEVVSLWLQFTSLNTCLISYTVETWPTTDLVLKLKLMSTKRVSQSGGGGNNHHYHYQLQQQRHHQQ